MHRIFGLIAGAIVFAWLVLDTARATILFNRIWDLISPFAAGAAIAFIFNVPMRAIENQLKGCRFAQGALCDSISKAVCDPDIAKDICELIANQNI